ncbi:MAG: hypothetical protein NTX50_20765 [Candidatus Sumerlaeota bacterium]|nr:hypothetical protein [Candidatus Sumerlaeota bacterium]
MKELFTMWRSARMIALVALSAVLYMVAIMAMTWMAGVPALNQAQSVSLKFISDILRGIGLNLTTSDLRPGAAVPVVMSFLFGPAAAWGSAIGNLIGDVLRGSTLGSKTLYSTAGNFLYGYLPYALWRALMGRAHPICSGAKGWLIYVVVLAANALACGTVIGWGFDALGKYPFSAFGFVIAINNLFFSVTIATIFLALLYGLIQKWGLLYYQILAPAPGKGPEGLSGMTASTVDTDSVKLAPPRRKIVFIGAIVCICGISLAFFSGLIISAEILHGGVGAAAFASAGKGTIELALGMAPGMLMMLIGAALL